MDTYHKSDKISLSSAFCLTCFALIVFMCCNMCSSHRQLKETQEIIINSHREHIKKVESYIEDYQTLLENEYNKISINSLKILDSLTHHTKNKQKIIAKDFYQGILASIKAKYINDELTIKQQFDIANKELLLNQNNLNKLLELHYAELSNQQKTLTTWATVLSIIFLTFGFFAIFKIEESKKEAQRHLKNIEKKCKKTSDDLTEVNSSIFKNIQDSNKAISSLNQKEILIDNLIASLSDQENGIHSKVTRIMSECENLDKLIDKYTDSMNDKYQQRLNSTIENGNKVIQRINDDYEELVQKFRELEKNVKKENRDEKTI